MSNSIFDAVSACSYPTNSKDYIGTCILELYNMSNTTRFHKVNKDGDKIIVAQYKVQATFKMKKYDVPILIYLPKNFPIQCPEVYIETKVDTGINPKNKDIDPNTKKMSLGALRGWSNYSSLKSIIIDCEISFNKEFPVYKITSNLSNVNNSKYDFSMLKGLEECFTDGGGNVNINSYTNDDINSNSNSIYNSTFSVPTYNNPGNLGINSNVNTNFPYNSNWGGGNNSNWNNNNINSNTNSNWSNNNNNSIYNSNYQNTIYNQKSNSKQEIKKKLVDELKKSLEAKLKQEVIEIKKEEEKLNQFKKELSLSREKYNSFFSNKKLIEENLNSQLIQISQEITNISIYTSNLKDNFLNQENYTKFLQVKGEELMKICAIEATLDDILMVIKKGLDKEIINFTDSVKLFREITKEIVKVKFYKEKLIKLNK